MPTLLRTALLLLLAWPDWGAAASYTAYNTYLHPPFVRSDGGGLAAELEVMRIIRMQTDGLSGRQRGGEQKQD